MTTATLLIALMVGQTPTPAPVAAPTIKLPPTLKAVKGKPLEIRAETTLKALEWVVPPGLQKFGPYDSGRVLVITALGDGPYMLGCCGASGDKPIVCVVVVEVGVSPGPTPPPAPNDPFVTELIELFRADKAATKEAAAKLASLYRVAVKHADGAATVGELVDDVREAAKSMIGESDLKAIRRRVSDELAKLFGDDNVALTPSLREKIQIVYKAASVAMEGLK